MSATDAYNALIARLTPRYGTSEAASVARIVLEDAFGIRGNAAMAARTFSAAEMTWLQAASDRLEAGEPLQYILGKADFFGYKFTVTPAVLIPRQETEELADWVLKYIKQTHPLMQPGAIKLLDIGTGSGCLAVTLKAKRPALAVWAMDVSALALAVARTNAADIIEDADPIVFVESDIVNRADWALFPAFHLIVSNPPYIPYQEAAIMPEHVLAHEPEVALFVPDEDPLVFYRVIAEFAKEKLLPGGALFFECNEYNATEVVTLLQKQGFSEVSMRQDIAGADRMVLGII
jgi:release factor glutamine methyltransferase